MLGFFPEFFAILMIIVFFVVFLFVVSALLFFLSVFVDCDGRFYIAFDWRLLFVFGTLGRCYQKALFGDYLAVTGLCVSVFFIHLRLLYLSWYDHFLTAENSSARTDPTLPAACTLSAAREKAS